MVVISEQIVSGSRGGEDGGRGGEVGGRGGGGERVPVHCTSSSSSDTLITACVLCFLNEQKSFL